MSNSEEFIKAFNYVDGLEFWVWHSLKDVPEDIATPVFSMVDSNSFMPSEVRLTWCEIDIPDRECLFFKSKIPK